VLRRSIATAIALLVVMLAPSAVAEGELTCTYDPDTGTVTVNMNGFSGKGGPLQFYDDGAMATYTCDVLPDGPVEHVVYTGQTRDITLNVTAPFTGGSPEDGLPEIEATLNVNPDFQFELWGRHFGGDYFDISATGDVQINPDGDIDMFVPAASLWVITGGRGNDVVHALLENVPVVVNAGPDDDVVSLGPSIDYVNASHGNDEVATGGGNDELQGGSGRDVLRSGQGDDVLRDERGRDALFGGGGDDTFYVQDGDRDVVTCGGGIDTVASADAFDVLSSDCESTIVQDV
jgi:Ca2+-binding RTX toxin-like protein